MLCNDYMQPKQYFVFSNIAIFVKVFLPVVVKMSMKVLMEREKHAVKSRYALASLMAHASEKC